MQLSELFPAARLSITDPRGGFRLMRSLGLEQNVLMLALIAITLVGVILAEMMVWLIGADAEMGLSALTGGPVGLAVLHFLAGMISAVFIHVVGRMFGGKGDFASALLVVVWMQFILTLVQVLQLVLMVVLPPLAYMLGIPAVVLVFWLGAGFIAEAHGFKSQFKTLIGMVALIFGLAILLVLLGVTPEMTNV